MTAAKAETTTNVLDNSFVFNDNVFALKWSDAIGEENSLISGGHVFKNKTITFDVTNYISPNINSYTLIPAQNQDPDALKGIYFNYYLFVCYENPFLPIVGTQIILNAQNAQQTLIYNTAINADINYNVGFTFNSYAFCQTVWDGSYIFINGDNIGLVGGDEVSDSTSCIGVRGAFYYQNKLLFGLDNDTATSFMNGTDALATIKITLLISLIYLFNLSIKPLVWQVIKQILFVNFSLLTPLLAILSLFRFQATQQSVKIRPYS